MVLENVNSLPTNGGNGPYSYSENSHYQRLSANLMKDKVDEAILEKLDVRALTSLSNRFCVADLGCATGPNTIITIQNILRSVTTKHECQSPNAPPLEFSVFLNDLPSNDFNTLFATLPDQKNCFFAGVPGSFHGRLFPQSSIHFVNCHSALHWLSKVPEELVDETSEAWNKGRVHYANAPDAVFRAYEAKFASDMENFLDSRAHEIVSGGLMVIGMCGVPKGMPFHELAGGIMYDLMGSILMDMEKESLVSEAQVDSFNLPIYATTPEEISSLVEKDGRFEIERMELIDPSALTPRPISMHDWTIHVRAAMEKHFSNHFGSKVTDELFRRLIVKLIEVSEKVEASYTDKILLFVVLRRK